MAKCKLCRTNIPEGTEYCKDCLDKENEKLNESYLDSLLNSVKNAAPTTESIYKKKSNVETNDTDKVNTTEYNAGDKDLFKSDLEGIEDFDEFDSNIYLSDLNDDMQISDEELFGEDYAEIFSDDIKPQQKKIETQMIDKSENQNSTEEQNFLNEQNILEEQKSLSEQKSSEEQNSHAETETPLGNKSNDASHKVEANTDIQNNIDNENELNEFDEDLDTDLNDLLNRLDTFQTEEEGKIEAEEDNMLPKEENSFSKDIQKQDNSEDFQHEEEEDDFLNLLNQIAPDDPVADDVKAINDLMNGGSVESHVNSNMPGNVGAVFSDALKAVSNLNDPNIDEIELLNRLNKKTKKNKKDKKNKDKKSKNKKNKDKNNKNSKNNKTNSVDEQETEGIEKKPKKNTLKKLFGNVEDEKSRKKTTDSKDSTHSENTLTKEKNKKSKSKKGKASNDDENLLDGDNKGKGKSGKEKAQDKKDKKKEKKDKKIDKKEKKIKTKEVIQVIDEIDEDIGRINRLGAFIVFVFFGLLLLLFVVGTNAVTYTLSIQHATKYFDDNLYNKAYNEVYGMELKDEDIELYDKIQTVMFVNKQLNSYNNYCAIGEYPEALDSLLKGLKRYDKYIELASILGIQTDMDYVRKQIITELNKKFNLTEKAAIKINRIDNKKDYSLKVYDVALKNE